MHFRKTRSDDYNERVSHGYERRPPIVNFFYVLRSDECTEYDVKCN